MRIGKRKQPAATPAQVEQTGRMTHAELKAVFDPDFAAVDILRQLDEAQARKLAGAGSATAASEARRGAVPPPTNRGGKSEEGSDLIRLVLENGVVKELSKRRGWGGSAAFVDWVNFTIGEETISTDDGGCVTDDQVMVAMSHRLFDIFGFGIAAKRGNGANFYKTAWDMGDSWGMVCHGGQRGTILVMINGTGCAAAKEGWEGRLMDFLNKSDRARITRLDLAHDDYTGKTYSVDRADMDHTNGLFNCGGRDPECEYRGNWKRPSGKGRTFNVGNRKNGKFCRVYEKGRQLGDENSEWTRIETEFKSVDRVIPFDALVRPGEYLAAAYPAFAWISERQERIVTTQKVVQAGVDKATKWLRHQCGASLGWLVKLKGVDQVLKDIVRDGDPAWTKIPHFTLSQEAIHTKKREVHAVDLAQTVECWA